MFLKLGTSLLCFFLFLADDCGPVSGEKGSAPSNNTAQTASASSSSSPSSTSAGGAAANAPEKPAADAAADACALIDKAEIAAVQGEQVRGVQPTNSTGNGFAVSQCYYTVTSSDGSKNLSVHLEVTRNDPNGAGGDALGALWRDKFQQAKDKKKSEKPRRVEGVGDEAFWVGNDKIGSLYAKKGGAIIRISVGGPDAGDAKVEKSKRLAAKAVEKLK